MRRLFKYLILIFAVIFLFGCIFIIFTQTTTFKNWLRTQIVTEINKSLNGQLEIGQIGGNLLSHFEISNILLISQGDTILYLPELTINFSPKHLLQKEIFVRVIALDSPFLQLKQMPDSSWNITNLIVTKTSPDTTARQEFAWRFSFEDIHVKNAYVALQLLDHPLTIPRNFDGLDFHTKLHYDYNGLKLKLWNLKLTTDSPQFTVDELTFLLSFQVNELLVEELALRTERSRLNGSATIIFSDVPFYIIELSAQPLDLVDMQDLIPDFPLKGTPTVTFNALSEGDSVQFFTQLQDKQQVLKLQGLVTALNEKPQYVVNGDFSKLDLTTWINDSLLSSTITGNFSMRSTGFQPESAELKLSANFQDFRLLQKPIAKMSLEGDYRHGVVNGTVHVLSNFGSVSIKGQISDSWSKQKFSLVTKLNHVDISQIIPDDNFQTDLNLTLVAKGEGLNPEKMKSKFELSCQPSSVKDIVIDTLFSSGRINKGFYTIDTLQMDSPIGYFGLSGNGDVHNENNWRFCFQPDNLDFFETKLNIDSLKVNGFLSGQLQGRKDSLFLDAKYLFSNLIFDKTCIDSIDGSLFAFYRADSFYGQSKLHLGSSSINELSLDAVDMNVEFMKNGLIANLDFIRQDSITGKINTMLSLDSIPCITIPMIVFNFKDHQWRGGSDSMKVVVGDGYYDFQNVKLGLNDQIIQINGVLSLNGQENLRLEISNVALEPFSNILNTNPAIGGSFSLTSHLKGTAENLSIEGDFVLRNGHIRDFYFKSWDGNLDYNDQYLSIASIFQIDEKQNVKARCHLPLNFSLTGQNTLFYENRPLHVELTTDALDFKVLHAVSDEVEKTNGKIYCDLKIENTFKKPFMSGSLRVTDGAFEIPDYGVNYKDIKLGIEIDSTGFYLKDFELQNGGGFVNASGSAEIAYKDKATTLTNTNLNIKSNNFLIASNKDLEVRLDSDLNFSGDLDNLKFGGFITIPRSRFYLPAFEGARPVESEKSLPLLVQAQIDTAIIEQPIREKKRTPSTFVQNLRGSVKINIPRNTWLRGPDVTMEIAGDLNLVKSGPSFELFGSIRTIRGNYTLYGKRFDIRSGYFTFQGGVEFNPIIELEVQHIFRSADKEKKTLKLQITDHLLNPKLQFSLNDIEIEETDAVSYLLFGRSLGELTRGEKSEIGQQPGLANSSVFKKLLAGQVTGQLSRTLQKKLNLDVIEFKGENNWRQTTIVIGKYITDDMFLSYQREFSIGKTNEVVPEQVLLEYEISRFLNLQATKGDEKATGFDLVWKFESKK